MSTNDATSNIHLNPHHFWYVATTHASELEAYYRVTGGFLCPDCRTISPSWAAFIRHHRFASQFSTSKKVMAREILPTATPLPINSLPTPPTPINSLPTPPTPINSLPTPSSINTLPHRSQESSPMASQEPQPTTTQEATLPPPSRPTTTGEFVISSALGRNYVKHKFKPTTIETSIIDLVESNKSQIEVELGQHCASKFKIQFCVKTLFKNPDNAKKSWFVSNNAVQYDANFLTHGAQKLQEKIESYSAMGSGWSIVKVIQVSFRCSKYVDFSHTTGHSFIPTPPTLVRKQAIINVQNKRDNLCFLYAILSILKKDQVLRNPPSASTIRSISI